MPKITRLFKNDSKITENKTFTWLYQFSRPIYKPTFNNKNNNNNHVFIITSDRAISSFDLTVFWFNFMVIFFWWTELVTWWSGWSMLRFFMTHLSYLCQRRSEVEGRWPDIIMSSTWFLFLWGREHHNHGNISRSANCQKKKSFSFTLVVGWVQDWLAITWIILYFHNFKFEFFFTFNLIWVR